MQINKLLIGQAQPERQKADQAAALCYRVNDAGLIEILLITSRDTGRWVLPKGNIDRKETAYRAAQREAREEAGVNGKVHKQPIGFFSYLKSGKQPLRVSVHLLRVDEEAAKYREQRQRRKAWFRPSQASALVDEPELRQLLALLISSDDPPLSASALL